MHRNPRPTSAAARKHVPVSPFIATHFHVVVNVGRPFLVIRAMSQTGSATSPRAAAPIFYCPHG